MDQIFWKRYADEYRITPQNPTSACVAGMLQVALIVFFLVLTVLIPVARLAMIVTNALQRNPLLQMEQKPEWNAGLLTMAALLSAFVVMRRYWHHRLSPEQSVQYRDSVDRASISLIWLAYAAGGLVLSAVAAKLFWL